MNAYELAEDLESYDWYYEHEVTGSDGYTQTIKTCNTEYVWDAANMLRQQADRIAELEKLVEEYEELEQNYMKAIQRLQSRIKENQSEPVALIKQGKYGYPMLVFNGVFKYDSIVVKQPDIPLYTTPQTKPLSDEEIHSLWETVMETRGQGNDLSKFARAIEAKVRGQ